MAARQYRTLPKRIVDRLAVDDKDAAFWDRQLPGFGLRALHSGAKIRVIQTRCACRTRTLAAMLERANPCAEAALRATEAVEAPQGHNPDANTDSLDIGDAVREFSALR